MEDTAQKSNAVIFKEEILIETGSFSVNIEIERELEENKQD